MPQPADSTYCVVLVPAGQVTGDGCSPGFVKLTGTPGAGVWEQWGPYRCAGQVSYPAGAGPGPAGELISGDGPGREGDHAGHRG